MKNFTNAEELFTHWEQSIRADTGPAEHAMLWLISRFRTRGTSTSILNLVRSQLLMFPARIRDEITWDELTALREQKGGSDAIQTMQEAIMEAQRRGTEITPASASAILKAVKIIAQRWSAEVPEKIPKR